MYEYLIHNKVDGWRRIALLPSTIGAALSFVIAEEMVIAWACPVRLNVDGERVTDFGQPPEQKAA